MTLVQFTDTSTGIIGAWLWDFGDGETSFEQNPLHEYIVDDTYHVTLTVFGVYGTQDSIEHDVTISTSWCKFFDFTLDDGGFFVTDPSRGVYVPGVGWQATNPDTIGLFMFKQLPSAGNVTKLSMEYEDNVNPGNVGFNRFQATVNTPAPLSIHQIQDELHIPPGGDVYQPDFNGDSVPYIGMILVYQGANPGGIFTVTKYAIFGTGTNPFGLSDCPF